MIWTHRQRRILLTKVLNRYSGVMRYQNNLIYVIAWKDFNRKKSSSKIDKSTKRNEAMWERSFLYFFLLRNNLFGRSFSIPSQTFRGQDLNWEWCEVVRAELWHLIFKFQFPVWFYKSIALWNLVSSIAMRLSTKPSLCDEVFTSFTVYWQSI